MCMMDGKGSYPSDKKFTDKELNQISNKIGKGKIKIQKILIGEAPPPTVLNYFYHPASSWTSAGKPGVGGTWTRAIQDALFGPSSTFPTKLAFLEACAKEGFLLLDLFPYTIPFTKTTSRPYRNAVISAFGFGSSFYPYSIKSRLDALLPCLDKKLALAFGLIRCGDPILNDTPSVTAFNSWTSSNSISLNPSGVIEIHRPSSGSGSKFLRVCGQQYIFGPIPSLLKTAGF